MPKPAPMPKPKPTRLDTDGDGVYNDQDKCPATPKGAKVDFRGCWVIGGINFDFDKSNIKEEFYPTLDEVQAVLKNNPILNVMIEGHTDGIGTAAYNQRLSERRAQAVKEYFVKAGIESHRMNAVGYGLTKPIASNDTEEGRAKNRRVEVTPVH
jgi:OOP family OmpA-OmpF porin